MDGCEPPAAEGSPAHGLRYPEAPRAAGSHHPLLHAAATLFLEQAIGEPAAMSYLVQTKKAQKLPQLPLIVDNLREQFRVKRVDLLTLFVTE